MYPFEYVVVFPGNWIEGRHRSRLRRTTRFLARHFVTNGRLDLCSFCTIMHITCILMSILALLCTFLDIAIPLCLSMHCHARSFLASRCIHSPALCVSNFRNHIEYMLLAYCACWISLFCRHDIVCTVPLRLVRPDESHRYRIFSVWDATRIEQFSALLTAWNVVVALHSCLKLLLLFANTCFITACCICMIIELPPALCISLCILSPCLRACLRAHLCLSCMFV